MSSTPHAACQHHHSGSRNHFWVFNVAELAFAMISSGASVWCCCVGTQLVAAVHHAAWWHQHSCSQNHPLGLLCGGVCLCNSQQRQPLHRLLAVWSNQPCLAENLDSFGSASAHVHPAGSFSSSQVGSLSTHCLLSGPTNPALQRILIHLAVPALIFIMLAAFQALRYAASPHIAQCQGLKILPHQSCLIEIPAALVAPQ